MGSSPARRLKSGDTAGEKEKQPPEKQIVRLHAGMIRRRTAALSPGHLLNRTSASGRRRQERLGGKSI
ncbi:MAG: hypothetical protein HDR26_10630 [Lachnospiraceae bacterium]|nr:hypothetical protein [Lachnospiraceae bacterium]